MTRYSLLKLSPATWVGATDREARRYHASFVEAIPSRMAEFQKHVSIEWVCSDQPIESFRDDLLHYDKFFSTLPMWEYHNPIGKRISVVVLNPAKRKELKQLEKDYQARGEWELSETGRSVMTDFSMLLGEYFRRRTPSLMWAVDELREDYFHRSTYLRNIAGTPVFEMHVHQYAGVLLYRMREDKKSLSDLLINWINIIRQHGPTRRTKVRVRAR